MKIDWASPILRTFSSFPKHLFASLLPLCNPFLAPLTMSLGTEFKISDKELDDLSSDDDSSDSSSDEEETVKRQAPVRTGSVLRKSVTDFEGFGEGFDEDDPIAKQMQAVLSLNLHLGVDKDANFLEEYEEKKRERERLANMTPEERIKHEEEKAGSLLSGVAQKMGFAEMKKKWNK